MSKSYDELLDKLDTTGLADVTAGDVANLVMKAKAMLVSNAKLSVEMHRKNLELERLRAKLRESEALIWLEPEPWMDPLKNRLFPVRGSIMNGHVHLELSIEALERILRIKWDDECGHYVTHWDDEIVPDESDDDESDD